MLSGRGAAGDVPAQAGRCLCDREGDARRPLARTLKQLGPPSRNRRWSQSLPFPSASPLGRGWEEASALEEGCSGRRCGARGKTRLSHPTAPPLGRLASQSRSWAPAEALWPRPSGDTPRAGLLWSLSDSGSLPWVPTVCISDRTPFRSSSLPGGSATNPPTGSTPH